MNSCNYCGDGLIYKSKRDIGRKHYCSNDCKHSSQVGKKLIGQVFKNIPSNCKYCKKQFSSKNKRNIFCSKQCQYESYYLNQRLTYKGSLEDHLFRLRKRLDRDYSLDFLLSLYKNQNGLCALSKVPMTWSANEGRVPTNISIDRIDSNLGYTEDNVQLVCRIVNIMKHDLAQPDFIKWCETIVEVYHT